MAKVRLQLEEAKVIDADRERFLAQVEAEKARVLAAKKLADINAKEQQAQAAATTKGALGLSGFRGTAIVGEAGGEVVASRSALRSGIGIGGRAAAELASIGVPGFQNGFSLTTGMNTDSAVATSGLQGRYGSEEYKKAQVDAAAKELAYQQEPMKQFWRDFYEAERDAAAEGEPQGPPLGKQMGDWLKEFWRLNERVIDKHASELLKNHGAGAKELYKGVFTGMSAWSQGMDSKQALTLGVQAGITEGFKKGGTLNKVFTSLNKSNAELLYVINDGHKIEGKKLDNLVAIGKLQEKQQDQLAQKRDELSKKALEAMGSGDEKALQAALKQIQVIDKQTTQLSTDIKETKNAIETQTTYVDKLGKTAEGSKTLQSLQYGVNARVNNWI